MSNKLRFIIFIDGIIRKKKYIAILEQNLLEYIDILMINDLRDIIFQ